MLDVNKYKASTKKFILFLFISFSTLTFVYKSINFTDYLDKEIQAFQSYFSSFSSIKQLVDNGELNSLYDMTLENYFELSKKIPKIALHQSKNILNEQDDNKISIKIDFKYLNKINDERKKALKIGINHKPNYYPCSISYQSKTYKCKVRLKGVFKDHWRSLKRMSLKIKLKDGFIEGINEFSIQKPRTRQFPYDFSFQKFISNFNIQGSDNQIFIRVMVNNDEWGVMNMEEAITDKFIERRNIKRNGVYNIGNLDFLYYDLLQDTYSEYYLSNPLIHIYPKTKFWKFSNHKYLQENFTYIFENISNKNFKIFDRKMMIMAYLLNLSWGDLHTLYDNNSSYSWNTYTKKLEPILTDQVNWKKIDYDNIVNLIHSTPSTYKLLFLNDPLSEEEFIDTLNEIKVNLNNFPILEFINETKSNFFPMDKKFSYTPIYKNINFLEKNKKKIVYLINKNKNDLDYKNKKNNLNSKNITNIEDFIRVFLYEDGSIKVFNLLDVPVNLNSINSENHFMDLNITLNPSSRNNLSGLILPIKIKEKKVSISTNYLNHNRITSNDFILSNLDLLFKSSSLINECSYFNNNECILDGNVIFDESTTFTYPVVITAGSYIELGKDVNLKFNNGIKILGEANNLAIIKGKNSGGIYILNENKDSISELKYVEFSGLSTFDEPLARLTGSLNGYGGKFKLVNVKMDNNISEDQLNISHSEIDIFNFLVKNSKSDAFDCDICTGTLNNVVILNSIGDGLDFSGSNIKISKLKISNIGDKAISIGENSKLDLNNIFISDSATGIAAKDGSNVFIKNITLNKIYFDSFMTYVKKPYFNKETSLKVVNSKFDNSGNLCVRENNSYLVIDNIECVESKVNVKNLYQERMLKIN